MKTIYVCERCRSQHAMPEDAQACEDGHFPVMVTDGPPTLCVQLRDGEGVVHLMEYSGGPWVVGVTRGKDGRCTVFCLEQAPGTRTGSLFTAGPVFDWSGGWEAKK